MSLKCDKPIINANLFALGPRIGLDPTTHCSRPPTCWSRPPTRAGSNMLVSKKPGRPNTKHGEPNAKPGGTNASPNTTWWNIVCVGQFRIGIALAM